MRKFFLSLTVVVASGGYVAYQYLGGSAASAAVSTPLAVQTAPATTPIVDVAPTSQSTATTPVQTTPTPASTPAPVVTTPLPATKPKGQYADGTYTGAAADAYYGMVQVKVLISGGKITDVTFLQYPSDRNTSRYINSQAMPQLKSQAIAAQSAHVSGVSGASDTSAAFIQSLGSALTQAKNA